MQPLDIVDQKLNDYFKRLATGEDVSPAQRFRLEGFLQACIELNQVDSQALLELKQQHITKTQQLSGVELTLPSILWALPYQVAVVSVNVTND